MGLADDTITVRRNLSHLALEHEGRAPGDSREDLLQRAAAVEKEAHRLRNRQLVAVALLLRVEFLLAVDRAPDAIVVLKQAEEVLGELRKDDLRVRALGHLAEAHGRLEEWKTVSAVCDEGIALVERYRYKLSADYLASAYLRSRVGLYSWGVRAAYELKDYELAIERAELSKCRLILSKRSRHGRPPSMEEIERESEFRDLCREIAKYPVGKAPEVQVARRAVLWDWMSIDASISSLGKFSLQAIQTLLSPDEGILFYYWVNQTTLAMTTIDRDEFAVELRHISPEQRGIIETFAYQALMSTTANHSAFEPARELGSFLLPDNSRVAWHKKQRLLISPHRMLHSIPFHAMRYENQWLIERAAVSYIPNLSSLRLSYVPRTKRRVLVVGVEHFDVPGRSLPPLPEAELEAKEVKQIYDTHRVPVTLLLEAEVTADRLRELEGDATLEAYSCLHFATHGDNINIHSPMESHFYVQNSLLDGLEIANLHLGAEIVVLSACCSGQRAIAGRGLKELPGDDLFGLQAAFFRAGARRVLGTLWPVDSSAARRIATGFHARLAAHPGCAPEVALQASMRDYLSQAGIGTRKIYFWAPFFLSVLGRAKSD
jgi:CHAT domain-containing protein